MQFAVHAKGEVERGVAYVRSNALKGWRFNRCRAELFLGQWEHNVVDDHIHGTTCKDVAAPIRGGNAPICSRYQPSLFPCYQEGPAQREPGQFCRGAASLLRSTARVYRDVGSGGTAAVGAPALRCRAKPAASGLMREDPRRSQKRRPIMHRRAITGGWKSAGPTAELEVPLHRPSPIQQVYRAGLRSTRWRCLLLLMLPIRIPRDCVCQKNITKSS